MQTFLPFDNYMRSARVLDNKRLCKQIVEAWQILSGKLPNMNHPAALMWRDYPCSLWFYTLECCHEYTRRFYKKHEIEKKLYEFPQERLRQNDGYPDWLGNTLLHLSHQVNLLRKDPAFYSKQGFRKIENRLDEYPSGYYWPIEPVSKKAKQDSENWKLWATRSKK